MSLSKEKRISKILKLSIIKRKKGRKPNKITWQCKQKHQYNQYPQNW